jgi:hypothetical protein
MTDYTVTYTETEEKAMQYVAADVNEWIQNAAHNRARIAIEEIVTIAVQKFLETGQSIPSSKEEIVAAAYTNGWIKTAVERNLELPNIPLDNPTANTI